MRQSKLLLIKNIERGPKRNNQMNLLSSLVEYSPQMKSAVINSNNLSHSPNKMRKVEKKKTAQKHYTTQYKQAEELMKVDFVKMFIVEELLYYISKTVSFVLCRMNE